MPERTTPDLASRKQLIVRRARGTHVKKDIEHQKIAHQMAMQWFLARFVCWVLGAWCFAALALFCLQGFGVKRFHLEPSLMHWVGFATVGALAGLARLVYRASFKTK